MIKQFYHLLKTVGDERYQNEKITGPEQKRPKNFQNDLHNNVFKKALVKFIAIAWDEEKYAIGLQNKELRISCKDVCLHYCVDKRKTMKAEDIYDIDSL